MNKKILFLSLVLIPRCFAADDARDARSIQTPAPHRALYGPLRVRTMPVPSSDDESGATAAAGSPAAGARRRSRSRSHSTGRSSSRSRSPSSGRSGRARRPSPRKTARSATVPQALIDASWGYRPGQLDVLRRARTAAGNPVGPILDSALWTPPDVYSPFVPKPRPTTTLSQLPADILRNMRNFSGTNELLWRQLLSRAASAKVMPSPARPRLVKTILHNRSDFQPIELLSNGTILAVQTATHIYFINVSNGEFVQWLNNRFIYLDTYPHRILPFNHIAFSSDETQLLYIHDVFIRIINLNDNTSVTKSPPTGYVRGLSRDGSFGWYSDRYRSHQLSTFSLANINGPSIDEFTIPVRDEYSIFEHIEYSSNKVYIGYAGFNRGVGYTRVYKKTGEIVFEHEGFCARLSFSPCNKYLVTRHSLNELKIYCLETRTCLSTLRDETIYNAKFSKCGKLLIRNDKGTQIWDIGCRPPLSTTAAGGGVRAALSLRGGGSSAAAGSAVRAIRRRSHSPRRLDVGGGAAGDGIRA